MDTLKFDLVETSLDSPLLYAGEENRKDFVHDTYRDFFLAKYFGDGICSGRVSMEKAYRNYWSHKVYTLASRDREDSINTVKPLMYEALKFLSGILKEEKFVQFISTMISDYFKRGREDSITSPVFSGITFAAKCLAENNTISNYGTHHPIDKLVDECLTARGLKRGAECVQPGLEVIGYRATARIISLILNGELSLEEKIEKIEKFFFENVSFSLYQKGEFKLFFQAGWLNRRGVESIAGIIKRRGREGMAEYYNPKFISDLFKGIERTPEIDDLLEEMGVNEPDDGKTNP